MEKGDTAVEVSPGPLPAPAPPAEKRPRRCVQSKLFFSPPPPAAAVEGEPKQKRNRKSERVTPKKVVVEAETPEEGKLKRKRNSRTGTPKKVVVEATTLEEGKPKQKRNARTRTPKKSPVTSTEACDRRAEINLSGEPDKEQEDAAGNNNCSKAVDSKSSSKNCRRMKNKQKNEATPEKVDTSRHPDPKELNSQQRVNKRSTPKKNLDAKKLPASPADLRLEAKIAAEENVRLSAGKQIHPFFTCSKATKRAPEVPGLAKVDNRWSVPYGDCLDSSPPIHVFDTFADDVVSLDWKNWIFMDKPSLNLNGYHAWESTVSVFEGSIEPLKLDTLFWKGLHMDKVKRNCSTSATTIHVLPNKQDVKDKMLLNSQDYVSTSGSFSPRCDSAVCNLENGDLDKLSNERFTSYYRRCSYSPQCSLWTNKYQPQNAIEVCGNKESIRCLSEWLKSWHERGLESRRSAICGDKNDNEDGEDSLYEVESDMDEINDDATLKNVLLITGPIGSGKSAAIYACAQEQGFEVIEVNASDTRNGSLIKQKYGEAMESHGFNRWSSEDPIGMRKKNILELLSSSTDIEGKQIEHDSQKMISRSSNLDSAPAQCSLDIMENRAISSQVANKSLILFEDVDTVFEEDRGFISTILQLAETAKRPIILTSNNKNPVLPRVLDRSVLDFTLPSPGELLPHLYMICASEKFHVPSHVLERLSRIYLGDIRKTLMLLQFWCQGNEGTERNMQFSYSPMLCDVDAAHLVMPRIIPWEFKCELSKKVEEEISKTITAVEDNLWFMEAMKQQDSNSTEFTGLLEIGNDAVNHIKPRKNRRLKRKRSMHDESEVSTHACNLEDFSDALESPVACARQTVRHRPGTVLSSQSDDQSDDGKCRPVDTVPYIATVPTPNDSELAVDPVYQFIMDDMIHNQSDDIETASVSHVCDTFRLQAMSCVPESSLVSVAETRNDVGLSTAVSSNNISATFADFIKSIHVPPGAEVEISDTPVVESSKRPTKIVGNACELDTESSHGIGEQGDLQDEDGEPRPTVYHLPDECSRVDFNMRVAPGKNRVGLPEFESVQGTWGKLRMCREDLKPHLTSNYKEACSILKLTSRLTDLISETDIMFGVCTPLSSDALEPSRMPCVELDAFSWYKEQLEMGSTYAQHGLCFYTNKCSIIGSNLGCGNTPNLAQEMLTSSKSTMAMGKLLRHGNSLLEGSHIAGNLLIDEPGCDISSWRELQSELYNAVLPVVPARLSLSLRGPAFHDYLSFMSQMSISECSRLSESPNKNHRRRPRASKHYLSSGSLPLSPERLKLLGRSRFFGEGCSKAIVFGGGN